jgi:hypothetical protein
MSSVFISHSANPNDTVIARDLNDELRRRGLTVFMDHALTAGEEFPQGIHEALSVADVVVVLLSSHSQKSRWIKEEVATALESRKQVIPVLLDDGARDNWVWPLLADRQARTVVSTADVHRLAIDIADAAAGDGSSSRAPGMGFATTDTGQARGTRRWSLVAVAVVAALLGALLTLLITR